MNEQQLSNAVALIRMGARAMANQEQDNSKAANILGTGEETVQLVVELAKPKETSSEQPVAE